MKKASSQEDAGPKISYTVVYILKSYDVLFWLQWDYRQNFLSPFLFLFYFLDLNWTNVQAKKTTICDIDNNNAQSYAKNLCFLYN